MKQYKANIYIIFIIYIIYTPGVSQRAEALLLQLRHTMGEMLTEHDGSEELKPPPEFPSWLLADKTKAKAVEEASSDFKILAKMRLMESGVETFYIQLEQGRTGNKFVQIDKVFSGDVIFHFPNILVPTDAYPLARAMDKLLRELATKEGLDVSTSTSGCHLLYSASSPGTNYNFQLDLGLDNGRFSVDLITCKNDASRSDYVERILQLSIKELFWLRHRMGEMLAEHDGSEELEKPPKYPRWLLTDRSKDDHPLPLTAVQLEEKHRVEWKSQRISNRETRKDDDQK